MQEYFPPKGLIVDLITPLNDDLSFAKNDFLNHIQRIRPYVDGIMILSPDTGEGFEFSSEEKKEIIGTCIEYIKSQFPIFICITGDTEEETKENMVVFDSILKKLLYDKSKINIFWVDIPLYYHSNRGLPDMYKTLCSLTNYPLLIYNYPGIVDKVKGPFNRRNIRTSVLKELSLIEHIVGLIFKGDLRRALNYQSAIRIRSNFILYDSDENLFLNFPNKNGLVSVSANLIPKVWKEMLYKNNDDSSNLEHIWDKGNMLVKLSDIIKEAPCIIIKELLNREGLLHSNRCRFKGSISQQTIEEVENIISHL